MSDFFSLGGMFYLACEMYFFFFEPYGLFLFLARLAWLASCSSLSVLACSSGYGTLLYYDAKMEKNWEVGRGG